MELHCMYGEQPQNQASWVTNFATFLHDLRKRQSFGFSELFRIWAVNLWRVWSIGTLQWLPKWQGSCPQNYIAWLLKVLFGLVLKAPSIASSRELVNSYCTLKLKELKLNGTQRLQLEFGRSGSLFLVEIVYKCSTLLIKLKENQTPCCVYPGSHYTEKHQLYCN